MFYLENKTINGQLRDQFTHHVYSLSLPSGEQKKIIFIL